MVTTTKNAVKECVVIVLYQLLVSREREKAWEKRNVFGLDLKPATVTTENIFLVVSSRQLVQSIEKRKSKNSVT